MASKFTLTQTPTTVVVSFKESIVSPSISVKKNQFTLSTSSIEVELNFYADVELLSSDSTTVVLKKLKEESWPAITVEKDENEDDLKEDSIDGFLRGLYRNASDDVKRAMNKSFVESNGTVLSTNWNEVGKKRIEPKL